MNLETVYMVSQIVASAAVALTLVAVLVSIRQNTRAQHVVAVQSITAAITAINVPAMESPALGNALASATRDWRKASREERILSHYFLFSLFKLCEQAWYQRNYGTLEHGPWEGWEKSLLRFFHTPGVKDGWWLGRRFAFSTEFQAFLEGSAPPPSAATLYDLFDGGPAISETQQP